MTEEELEKVFDPRFREALNKVTSVHQWWWNWLDATLFPMPQPSDEQLLNNPANARIDWRVEEG